MQDETKGWRGTSVPLTLGGPNWQSDVSQPNPFIKIQIALSILVDQNPTGVFTATSKKFQATTELIKQLYSRSWDYAKSKQQLKLFVFNLAKYGWACARTYPLKIERTVNNLVEWNEDDPSKSKYEEKDVVEYNDIMRENLDPWNVWIDDMAKPSSSRSLSDWAWRKVYRLDEFKEEFGAWPNAEMVQSGGTVTDKLEQQNSINKKLTSKDLVEVYFYECLYKDLFYVIANGVPVVISPLPVSDSKGLKKLSLWQTYWNLRHAECPYGVGIYEAIRMNQGLLDRINNMSIDQLTLSIYKMFFYQGTNALTETGDIKIAPGVGKQTLDPKNIQFLQVPGPGPESIQWLQMIKNEIDEGSGITDPLMGQITGKTAFEIAQAKESALKRLKVPLDNITDALDTEAYITISLMQLIYSTPETYEVSDSELIQKYLNEVQSDPDLYERNDEGVFTAKVYPEFPLNLDKDEEDNLIETEDTRFFRVKPKFLNWEGLVSVKAQSVLTPSEQLSKAQDLEMTNILVPLLAQPPELFIKLATELVKIYDKDPKDWLPDSWLNPQPQQQNLIVPAGQTGQGSNGMNPTPPPAPEAQTLTSTQPPSPLATGMGGVMNSLMK